MSRARARAKPAPDAPPSLTIAGAVATIRFERPSEHNRIDPDDIPVLRSHLARVATLPDLRAVVITGSGARTFSSGFTVGAILARLDRSFENLLDEIETLPLPTICALNGSVYGGATDLALCCDVRLGVRGTEMFMPAAKFGLHYYPGGLRRFVAAVGLAQTKRIFLTAQTLRAEEMLRIGFLTELMQRSALERRIAEYVAAFEGCEPSVVKSMKHQLNALARGDFEEGRSRTAYEASRASAELKRRLAVLSKR
jgi:enoyl-CoA hydratase/carnithine racemase